MNFLYSTLRWIEPFLASGDDECRTRLLAKYDKNSRLYLAWAGFAFETICLKHIAQIRKGSVWKR